MTLYFEFVIVYNVFKEVSDQLSSQEQQLCPRLDLANVVRIIVYIPDGRLFALILVNNGNIGNQGSLVWFGKYIVIITLFLLSFRFRVAIIAV
jgi:hypothetical protein